MPRSWPKKPPKQNLDCAGYSAVVRAASRALHHPLKLIRVISPAVPGMPTIDRNLQIDTPTTATDEETGARSLNRRADGEKGTRG